MTGPLEHQPGSDPTVQECVEYLDRIVYFIDNELDDADCTEVRVHLDSCNPCLARYDLQVTVKQVVARSCSEQAPTDLRDRVLLRLREVRVQLDDSAVGPR